MAISTPASAPPTRPRRRPFANLGLVGSICLSVLLFWGLVSVFGPFVAPHPLNAMISDDAFGGFGESGLLLGSDYLGRDVLSRIIFGARMTFGIALAACLIAFLVGTTLGFAVALVGGLFDDIVSRANDAFLAFPSIMLALIVISTLGSSLSVLILTIGFVEATRNFRVARAVGMEISVMDFVVVSRARGEGTWWLLTREILPNSLGPLLTEFGLRFIYSILLVSTLSFIGLGVQPPQSDWGGMVRENMAGVHFFAPAVFLPALCIFSVTLAVNLLIDWNLSRSNKDISKEVLR